MSGGMILASPKPFPESIYLTDMDVDDGKPFKYRPAIDLCACPIETGYCPENSMYEYEILSDLPKILPKYIYFGGAYLGYHDDEKRDHIRYEINRNYDKFLAFVKYMVDFAGEICILQGAVPSHTICSDLARICNVCVDYMKKNRTFKYKGVVIYRFVRQEDASEYFDDIYPSNNKNCCCVTLLSCPNELSENYSKEYGLEFPSFGITTPYHNQHQLKMNENDLGLNEEYRYLLDGLSDLDIILYSNLYISGLNPSFYPWGNTRVKMEKKIVVLKLIKYLQSIVNEQGEAWYIRQWIPDRIANADNISIKTLRIKDLDLTKNEFEFELCTLYHFVK